MELNYNRTPNLDQSRATDRILKNLTLIIIPNPHRRRYLVQKRTGTRDGLMWSLERMGGRYTEKREDSI